MKRKISALLVTLIGLTQFNASAQTQHPCAIAKQKIMSNHKNRFATARQINQMAKYDVNYYKLDVALERTSTYISGNVIIQATVKAATLDTFVFELHHNLTIDSVLINNQLLAATHDTSAAQVPLSAPLTNGQPITAQIFYHGMPPSGGSAAIGNGMSNQSSPSWGNQVTYSLSESFVAYEWWPCKQYLPDKADSSDVWITTDSANKAGSNGILANITDMGNGKKRFEWKSRYPIDYYLISVAVAQYVDYSIYAHPINTGDSVLIQNFVYSNPQTLINFKPDLDKMKDIVELFSKLYGPYPFHKEKYGHCMAPLSGGMEHQTMTTQGFFEFSIDAHEFGHQWFGDNVTCETWGDIWVNEGFASYTEYLAYQYLDTTNSTQWLTSKHNSVLGQVGGSIYFPDTLNTARIFDSRLTYDKGALLLHLMRYIVHNDSMFFLGYRNYQALYKGKVATSEKFKTVMANTTGINFDTVFNQWYYGEGYPTISLQWDQNNHAFTLKSTQVTSVPSSVPYFIVPIQYTLKRAIGDTIINANLTNVHDSLTIPYVSGTITTIAIDPKNWIINKNGSIIKVTGLGMEDLVNDKRVVISPNPFNNQFKIDIENNIESNVTVTDVNGKEVIKSTISEHNNILNGDKLSKGIYFVKVQNREYTKVLKIVKE